MTVRPPNQAQSLQWTADDETRITSIGHFLRDYGLDELLASHQHSTRGEMSIVGPRPLLPGQEQNFDAVVKHKS